MITAEAERASSGEEFSALPPDTVQFLPPSRLQATVDQPRNQFDDDAIAEMTQSIKDQHAAGRGVGGTGILQPIIVRYPPGVIDEHGRIVAVTDKDGNVAPVDFKFFITIGETRWRGALAAGVPLVPVIIKEQSKEDAYEDALIENINRNNLSPLDEARAIRHIMNRRSLSFRGVAKYLHKNVGYIQNRLDALRVQPDMQQLITEKPDSLTAAVRMDKVASPPLRAALIKAAKEGVAFDALRHLIQADRIEDEAGLRAVVKLIQRGAIEQARVELGRHRAKPEVLADDRQGDEGEGADERGPTQFGTPRAKGIRTLPAINCVDALDSLLRQAQSVRHAVQVASLPRKEYRENILPRVAQLREVLDEIEAAGAKQEARFTKTKTSTKIRAK